MDISLYLQFLAAALALTLLPGPDNVYVLTESATRGAQRGLPLAWGLAAGVLVHTTLAATGLALLLRQENWLYSLVQYSGAAYLLYLAISSLREAPPALASGSSTAPFAFWTSAQKGFLMNVLNPKVTLFFVALLPQFVATQGWPPWQQMIVLGATFMLQAALLFSALALLAARLSSLLRRERFWQWARGAKFVILLLLALGLALG